MAKLSGPLLSFGASGSVGDAVTFTKRKRQNVAKSHSVPANPNSTDQAAQRSRVTSASNAIQAARALTLRPFIQADIDAWSLLAKSLGKKSTWFNMLVSNHVAVAALGNVPAIFRYWSGSYSAPNISAQLRCDQVGTFDITAGHWFYGLSPTSMIYSISSSFNPPTNLLNKPITPLASGAWHYLQFKVDAGENSYGAYSGIYRVFVP